MSAPPPAYGVWQWPMWVYQRYRLFWDRALLGGGWSLLFALCERGTGAYPLPWRAALAGGIVALGLIHPLAGYAAFVLAIVYPLYTVSIYVMALALSTLILTAIALARAGPWSVALLLLVLLSPLLGPVNLIALPPLIAGLVWGPLGGAIGGGAAALWIKICAGMTGGAPDLWQLNGWVLRAAPVYDRFHGANSFQTATRLVESLGVGSDQGLLVLYNLLQVLAWAAAGYAVGLVRKRWPVGSGGFWSQRGGGTAAVSLGTGTLLIWVGYVAVPSWLGIDGPRPWSPRWLPAQILWAAVVAWILDCVLRYLDRPVSLARHRRHRSRSGKNISESRWTHAAPTVPGRARSRPRRKSRSEQVGGGDPRDPLVLLRKSASGSNDPAEALSPRDRREDESADIMIELD